jgi:ribosome biogenesis GTPase
MNRVIAVSRNCAFIKTSDGQEIEITLKGSTRTAVVGDNCSVTQSLDNFSILPRTNILSRRYGNKKKNLAANIDHLFIVTAVKPGIHTLFIDRTLSSCIYEQISVSILLNKCDLDLQDSTELIAQYKDIGFDITHSCAKTELGCEQLIQYIKDNKFNTVAFCGISGVGKSSLINKLAPNALSKVGQLSDKAQAGKQTTSMARMYDTKLNSDLNISVIDLPGLQHFGICNIPLDSLAATFPEFLSKDEKCRFNDCSHTTEPECIVLNKLISGKIYQSRYKSYLDMRQEILSTSTNYGKSN